MWRTRFALDGYRGTFKDVPLTGAFLDSLSRERDSDTGAYCVSMRFTFFLPGDYVMIRTAAASANAKCPESL